MLNDYQPYDIILNESIYKIERHVNIAHATNAQYLKYGIDNIDAISVNKIKPSCIFIDDERVPKDVYWVKYPEYYQYHVIRTFDGFKEFICDMFETKYDPKSAINMFDFSFDHDLQCFDQDGNEYTGYDCVKWLCDYLIDHDCDLNNFSYIVHSQNPIGSKNINTYIENYKRFLNGQK